MNLKLFVGMALALSAFLAGSILMFGLFQDFISGLVNKGHNLIFLLAYLNMCFLIFLAITWQVKNLFKERSDFLFLLIFGFLICLSLAFTATGAKFYHEKTVLANQAQEDMSVEIDTIAKTNEYYTDYAAYLKKQIDYYKNSSKNLQAEIRQLENTGENNG